MLIFSLAKCFSSPAFKIFCGVQFPHHNTHTSAHAMGVLLCSQTHGFRRRADARKVRVYQLPPVAGIHFLTPCHSTKQFNCPSQCSTMVRKAHLDIKGDSGVRISGISQLHLKP